jgi:hypothetical protein
MSFVKGGQYSPSSSLPVPVTTSLIKSSFAGVSSDIFAQLFTNSSLVHLAIFSPSTLFSS